MIETGVVGILVLSILSGLLFALFSGLHEAGSVAAAFISCRAAAPRQAEDRARRPAKSPS